MLTTYTVGNEAASMFRISTTPPTSTASVLWRGTVAGPCPVEGPGSGSAGYGTRRGVHVARPTAPTPPPTIH